MKNLLLLGIVLLFFACTPVKEKIPSALNVASGRVVRLDSFPSKYVADRNVDIWLPEGYSSTSNYPVLYMHDGQMLFDSTTTWNKQEWGIDEIMGKLIKEKKIKPMIVVGAWNGGQDRHIDYFPQKPFESLPESYQDSLVKNAKRTNGHFYFSKGVQSDNYLKFLVEELKPYIDKYYPTLKNRENTFIAGSSMGGLISMYAICEYPETFGAAACLSTHWPGAKPYPGNPVPNAFMEYLAKNLPTPKDHKIYFDYGTETLDAFYEPHQLGVDSVMRLKGYDAHSWTTKKFPGANHSERAWMARIDQPLLFITDKN
ncbi:MAG: esterase family protein [Bacteroidia bacterium]|nr:esterase family protein [Bacteroidia bacterium]